LHKYERSQIEDKEVHHCEQNIKEEMEMLSKQIEEEEGQVKSLKAQAD